MVYPRALPPLLLLLVLTLAPARPARATAPPPRSHGDRHAIQFGWSSRADDFYGLTQLALYESGALRFYGALQLGLFSSRAGELYGALQLGALNRVEACYCLAQVGGFNRSRLFSGLTQLGLVNLYERQFVGLVQLALINVHVKPAHTDFAGVLQVGLLNVHEGEFFGGAQIGLINGNHGRSEVILALGQLGLFNYSATIAAPMQLGLINVADRLSGTQLSLGLNWSNQTLDGLQLGPVNRAVELHGVQVGLLGNVAGAVHGAQIGLINSAVRLRGVQIGLINLSEEGGLPFSVIANVGW